MTFQDRYNKLNKAQKEAVDSIEGPVMAIAGPGTGKTEILTLRVANILLKTDTPASAILALTFTEAGAKEMKRRLRSIIGPRADEVRICTYHGFAVSIINEFKDHFPHLSQAKQLTDIEAEVLVKEILKDPKFSKLRPLGDPDFYVVKILSTIGDSKKEAWTPAIVKSFAEKEIDRIKNDESSLSTRGQTKGKLKAEALKRIEKCERTILFSEVYNQYELEKRKQRKIDFDDQIMELLLALERDELLLRLLQEKFLYILVDEHQDTNDSQNMPIRLIADFFDQPNLFVVGDEKQAIYRFQGASVENFIKFQSIWGSMKIIPLEINYRSHQHILDAVFPMIENNYFQNQHQDLRVKLRSESKEDPKPIDLVTAVNLEAADSYLVTEMKRIQVQEPDKSVAIIVRLNADIQKVLMLLERNGISATAERGTDIFSHYLGRSFFSFMQFLADPSQVEALAASIASGLWDLGIEREASLIRALRRGNFEDIYKEVPAISILRQEINQSGSISYLIRAATLSGTTKLASQDPLSAEVWRGIISLAEDLTNEENSDDPKKLIQDLLTYKLAKTKNVKTRVGMPDAQISIMTAHGSKGLEFDYVFMPYATEESWMFGSRSSYFVLPKEGDREDEIRDSRRLFYVAATRARKHVSIISPLNDGSERPLTPLRFLGELSPESVSLVNIPAILKDPSTRALPEPKTRYLIACKEYAKRSILENGLSVTALNHFKDCRTKFLLKSVLKLPEPPTASAERGNAMHEALARVWHLNRKDKAEETIIESVKEYFKQSLLPSFEKEVIINDLVGSASVVASALKDHLAQQGNISTETPQECVFESRYQGSPISIRLHGKLDALLETSTKVFVFDYKTREALSTNAIKGETKNDDGNYFRQLVFYKLLLANNPRFKNKEIEPSLVFIKPDNKGRCPVITIPINNSDIDKVKEEINSLIESVWSGKFLTEFCADESCQYCSLRRI